MKYCRILPLFFLALILGFRVSAQETPASPLPTNGHLDGAVYQNTFFGLKYVVPEQWVGRSTAAKMPGVTNGYVLVQARRKAGDPLSSLTVAAIDLATYGGKLEKYIDERYRPKTDTESDTSINGVRLSKGKAPEIERELLMLGERPFYRISTESTGVRRVSVLTSEKGYALIFELIVPVKYDDITTPAFMDSMLSVEFGQTRTATANK